MDTQLDTQSAGKEVERILNNVRRKVRDELYQFFYAVDIFEFVPVKESIKEYLCTDGEHIFFNPEQIMKGMSVRAFTSGYNETFLLEKLLVHMTLHGMLGHFEADRQFSEKRIVGIIMDAQVNFILNLLDSKYANNIEESDIWDNSEECDRVIGYSEYYKALCSRKELRRWFRKEKKYSVDEHELWMSEHDVSMSGLNNNSFNINQETKNESQRKWEQAREVLYGSNIYSDMVNIIGNVIVSMNRMNSNMYGNDSGNNVEIMQAADDKGISYRELINKLVVEKEISKELVDSIDVMMYTYGLELYSDVPLVEPNEVNEIKHLDNIIIAIDTSGSCGGYVAQRFIRETYNLFNEIRDSFEIESIHLIQCDTDIQDEKIFTSVDELPLDEEMNMKGFGGTSFIPVFERADELQKKDNKSIEAVIYFTDGYGEFPDKEPDYPVYLVMDEEEIDNCDYIPEWAECVAIDI